MRSLIIAAAIVVALTGPAFAQGQGQINGVITDSSGAVVPGVAVTAVEQQTGLARETISGANGLYTFPALRPTIYEIRAVLTGFRTIRRTGIELLANQNLTVNVTLELGELNETVSVAGDAANVDITTATISEVVDHARIVELPLNGRDAAKLTTLVAGTVISSVSTETGKTIPGALRLSSNGSQALSVSFRLDGTSNTDLYEHENLTFPFPEALQEFSIQTSNYSAAQGNSSGAVINAVTRSGTNSFHGGAFGYVRNKAFNSSNFFASEPDALDRRQYGGFLGGPVKLPGYDGTNRTFFFVGWQGTLLKNTTATTTVFAPTNDQRNGNFATCGAPCNVPIRDPLTGQPFPGNQIPVSRFDPSSVKLMSHFARVGGTGQHQVSRASAMDFNQVVLKVDHQVTNNDQLSGRYFIDHFDNAAIMTPGDLLSYRTGSPQSRVRSQSGVYCLEENADVDPADRNTRRVPAHARGSRDPAHTESAGARHSAPAVSDDAESSVDQRGRVFQRRCRCAIRLRQKRRRGQQPDELDEGQAQHPVRRRRPVVQGDYRQRVPRPGHVHLQRQRHRQRHGRFHAGRHADLRSGHR